MRMKRSYRDFSLFLWLLLLLGIHPHISLATSEVSTTQEEAVSASDPWTTELHPNVVSFYRDASGVYHGVTDDGQVFTQFPFYEDDTYRIERFEIGEHHHYIVNGVVFYTLSSLPSPIRKLEL